jgi:hypothetical protein
MRKLPPKWRRMFWRWHDRILDAAGTAPGRFVFPVVLLFIVVVALMFMLLDRLRWAIVG